MSLSQDTPSFITEDVLNADIPPATTWNDFKQPKLRKFPQYDDEVRWMEYLGCGWDGLVFKARFGYGDPVAVKLFWRCKPRPDEYWSFEKECRNVAILEKMKWALKKTEDDSNQSILLQKDPRTRTDAIRNLRAFSDEARLSPEKPHNARPPPPFPPLTACYGWMKMERRKVPDVSPPVGPPPGTAMDEAFDWNWVLVYELVPAAKQDLAIGQLHLDFFFWGGFAIEPYKFENWRGGRLIDFCELSTCLRFRGLRWNKYGWRLLVAETWFTYLECMWPGRKHVLVKKGRTASSFQVDGTDEGLSKVMTSCRERLLH